SQTHDRVAGPSFSPAAMPLALDRASANRHTRAQVSWRRRDLRPRPGSSQYMRVMQIPLQLILAQRIVQVGIRCRRQTVTWAIGRTANRTGYGCRFGIRFFRQPIGNGFARFLGVSQQAFERGRGVRLCEHEGQAGCRTIGEVVGAIALREAEGSGESGEAGSEWARIGNL